MKTAEEWLKDLDAPHLAEPDSGLLSARQLKIIQLDALKEGMRRAANVAAKYDYDAHSSPTVNSFRMETNILTAAEQLTKKDL